MLKNHPHLIAFSFASCRFAYGIRYVVGVEKFVVNPLNCMHKTFLLLTLQGFRIILLTQTFIAQYFLRRRKPFGRNNDF